MAAQGLAKGSCSPVASSRWTLGDVEGEGIRHNGDLERSSSAQHPTDSFSRDGSCSWIITISTVALPKPFSDLFMLLTFTTSQDNSFQDLIMH